MNASKVVLRSWDLCIAAAALAATTLGMKEGIIKDKLPVCAPDCVRRDGRDHNLKRVGDVRSVFCCIHKIHPI
ncbi:hypothetical protein J3Q64DRAFT_1708078 [Phycomyces blakesleeanus]|uniref:Secreted protein n=1 Tax=Phycomyces blakesleeanus TaxID=4837 RepID=A0ABR3BD82_PHYBL